jgi:hypothetical protein
MKHTSKLFIILGASFLVAYKEHVLNKSGKHEDFLERFTHVSKYHHKQTLTGEYNYT